MNDASQAVKQLAAQIDDLVDADDRHIASQEANVKLHDGAATIAKAIREQRVGR